MRDDLGSLGKQVFANIANIQQVWFEKFGRGFYGTWQNSDEAIQEVVTNARDTLASNKGTKNRRENKELHATLFLRDPISDRLILRYSTNQDLNPGNPDGKHEFYFSGSKMDNYDTTTDRCYYQLHDRLSTTRAEESTRKARGLTGWVAVTGVPLKINNLKHADALAGQCCEDEHFKYNCRIYGIPMWSKRISEFPNATNSVDDWSKRYMAVPIQSLIDTNKSIDVLRFVSNIRLPELSEFDLIFIEGIGNILSALINMENVKTIANRDERLSNEIIRFEKDGDFSRFLRFTAEALRSKISSLYIS